MSYLLDGLHEDLNHVHNKLQMSQVEWEGSPDKEIVVITVNWSHIYVNSVFSMQPQCLHSLHPVTSPPSGFSKDA